VTASTRTHTLDDELVWPRREPSAGQRVGRYRVIRKRGAGAMGVVYEAWDARLQRKVAVKVLHPTGSGRAAERRRIRREARAMATVSHPGVVPVYDVGEFDGLLYVVMELVDASDLAHWLTVPRSIEARMKVLATAGEGVAAAHRAGLVHRDIKPSNILVTADGFGRVTDFGLAVGPSVLDAGESHARVVGTPAYMAPEQFESRPVDARADQYALCVTAWEVLLGERPFEARGAMALIQAKAAGPPASRHVPGLPHGALAAVARGLSPAPDARWPDIPSLLAAMRAGRPRWASRAALLGGVALAVGLAWPASNPCGPGIAALEDAWSPARRAEVEVALRGEIGAARATEVVVDIDDRARDWTAAYRRACAGSSAVGDQIDPRRRCLVRARREMVAWFGVFDHSPRRALRALPSLARAADCEADDLDTQPIDDPYRYDAIEAALADGWAARVEGRFAEAERRLADAVTEAREVGHLEQLTVALRRLGSVQDTRGRPNEALVTLREAVAVAQESGSDRHLAEAWVELTWVEASLSKLDEAERSQRAAAAALARVGGDRRIDAARLTNVAALRAAQGREAEGVVALQEALALWDEETERPRLRDIAQASIEKNLAAFALRSGDVDAALQLTTSAQDRLLARYGDEHPDVAELQLDLALIYDQMEDYDSARVHAERAREILRAGVDSDHPLMARVELMLAYAAHATDDLNEAAMHLGRAADIRIRAYGEGDEEAWGHRVNLARMRFDLGDIAGADDLAQRAKLAIGESVPATPASFAALMTAGQIAVEAGRVDAGVVDLQRALDELDTVYPPDDARRADAVDAIATTFEEIGDARRAAEVRARAEVPDQASTMRNAASGEIE
jgi:tetratricopeptide (TPR) repeat protein